MQRLVLVTAVLLAVLIVWLILEPVIWPTD
jgi:hypothetical protein